jgi:outer membrane protein assembly factor BamB
MIRLSPRLVMVGLLAAVCTAVAGGAAADVPWPQWRGPAGEGHAPGAHDLPVAWSETEHVAWKTPLPGRGWSSPVLDERLVWMTTALEHEAPPDVVAERAVAVPGSQPRNVATSVSLHAVAVDRDTGTLAHDIELFRVDAPQPIHTLNSYASPSPVLAAGRLYCQFGDYGTACVDTATGTILWKNRDLRLDHMNGPGSTPILYDGLLIVNCDGCDVQEIAALDAASGRIAWKTPRSGPLRDNPDLKKAYATPLIVKQGDRDVLISPGADWVYGYDPENGRELWRRSYGVLGFSIVPRPVAAHGFVFMSTGFMKPEMLALRPGSAGAEPEIVWRHPFPGPGLAIRIVGAVDEERLSILRAADAIAREELTNAGLDRDVWQFPVVLLADVRSVGVQGDGRTYGHPIVLRPVSSEDAMTADWSRLPYDLLARISTRITNEVRDVNRVTLDITSKPPGTIEWE